MQARRRLQRHGRGPGQHGHRLGRRGRRRPGRPVRHAPDRRDEHALEAGAARACSATRRRSRGSAGRAGAAPASARSWPTSTTTAPSTWPSSTAASPAAPPADDPDLARFWRPYAERNQLFANDGKGRFRDVSTDNAAFCETPSVARGLAVGDVINDGSLALLTSGSAAPPGSTATSPPARATGTWSGHRRHRPGTLPRRLRRRRSSCGPATAGGCAGSTRPAASCAATILAPISDWARSDTSMRSRSSGRTGTRRRSTAGRPTGSAS